MCECTCMYTYSMAGGWNVACPIVCVVSVLLANHHQLFQMQWPNVLYVFMNNACVRTLTQFTHKPLFQSTHNNSLCTIVLSSSSPYSLMRVVCVRVCTIVLSSSSPHSLMCVACVHAHTELFRYWTTHISSLSRYVLWVLLVARRLIVEHFDHEGLHQLQNLRNAKSTLRESLLP